MFLRPGVVPTRKIGALCCIRARQWKLGLLAPGSWTLRREAPRGTLRRAAYRSRKGAARDDVDADGPTAKIAPPWLADLDQVIQASVDKAMRDHQRTTHVGRRSAPQEWRVDRLEKEQERRHREKREKDADASINAGWDCLGGGVEVRHVDYEYRDEA